MILPRIPNHMPHHRIYILYHILATDRESGGLDNCNDCTHECVLVPVLLRKLLNYCNNGTDRNVAIKSLPSRYE